MNFIENILKYIFPTVCCVCNEINEKPLCEKCEKQILAMKLNLVKNYKNMAFDKHFNIFNYEGIIKKKILEYKFNDKGYLYNFFSYIILNDEEIIRFIKNYDIIIPVPIDKKRFNERGYNQSELICKKIAKVINVKYNKESIYKIKNLKPQSRLNKEQRSKNVLGAYYLRKKDNLKSKKILIFDDVFTTGATANECAKILKSNLCGEIGILTIAKS